MEQYFIYTIRRRLWLILLAMIVASITTYLAVKNQPVEYIAKARMIIGPGIESSSPDLNTLRASGQLLQTYAELPKTGPFLQSIIDQLQLDLSPNELARMINVKSNQETQILTIEVVSSNPDLASMIANKVTEELVRISPSSTESPSRQVKDQMSNQVADLEQSILKTEALIASLEAEYQRTSELALQTRPEQQDAGTTSEVNIRKFEADISLANDPQTRRSISEGILQELVIATNARINKLENDLEVASSNSAKRLILDQIALERQHLSNLHQTLLELRRTVEGKTLEEFIAETEARINQLEADYREAFGLDSRRLILDLINQERNRLADAQNTDNERQRMVMAQIAEERNRLSDLERTELAQQQLLEEKKQQLLNQITQERDRLSDEKHTLALLYESLQKPTTNQISIIEPAIAVPTSSQVPLTTLVGGMAGLLLSLMVVIGYEYFSDSIDTVDDLRMATDAPILGTVFNPFSKSHPDAKHLPVIVKPQSNTAEDYRMLSAKMLFSNNRSSFNSVLICGIGSDEDSGTVAANLGIVLAQTGKKVSLIDANLHQPTISRIFKLERHEGLTEGIIDRNKNLQMMRISAVPGFVILPSGKISDDSFKLLASLQMVDLLQDMKSRSDITIVAAPSVLSYAETLFLASHIDTTILILESGKTRRGAVRKAVSNLRSVGANLAGIIFHDERSHARYPEGATPPMEHQFEATLNRDSKPLTQVKTR